MIVLMLLAFASVRNLEWSKVDLFTLYSLYFKQIPSQNAHIDTEQCHMHQSAKYSEEFQLSVTSQKPCSTHSSSRGTRIRRSLE